jgi:putative Mg2+ transporter-C (MgtC) family protein
VTQVALERIGTVSFGSPYDEVRGLSTDLPFQFDLTVRLGTAALLGALLGLEREIHGHQAGMRTHMLVALGSALFTILSIYGFPQAPGEGVADPSRISAQIVTGIGFLGAGAIVTFGPNVRGLTTAASLWVMAAIGLAAGAGAYYVAALSTAIAVLALWPLHLLAARLERMRGRIVRVRLTLRKIDTFGAVSQAILGLGAEIRTVETQKVGGGHAVDLEVRLPAGRERELLAVVDALAGAEVDSIGRVEEA